jgi:hypothetical protein
MGGWAGALVAAFAANNSLLVFAAEVVEQGG